MTKQRREDQPASARPDLQADANETVHNEHSSEPAEGARYPGEEAEINIRAHPSEPAEGRWDIG
ncbi:MAG TPA: hypothetical protein VIL01_00980 [Thermomicrobiales bacterium]|mgnify:CR=1 FL=1